MKINCQNKTKSIWCAWTLKYLSKWTADNRNNIICFI